MVGRQTAGRGKVKRTGDGFTLAGIRRGNHHASGPVNQLRNPGTANSKDRDAVFRGPYQSNPGVEAVLISAPIRDVHGGSNNGPGALFDQFIGDPAVTQIIADTYPEPAPG